MGAFIAKVPKTCESEVDSFIPTYLLTYLSRLGGQKLKNAYIYIISRVENINFKLNLDTFLLLWFWISLLGLAALDVQTFTSEILFLT